MALARLLSMAGNLLVSWGNRGPSVVMASFPGARAPSHSRSIVPKARHLPLSWKGSSLLPPVCCNTVSDSVHCTVCLHWHLLPAGWGWRRPSTGLLSQTGNSSQQVTSDRSVFFWQSSGVLPLSEMPGPHWPLTGPSPGPGSSPSCESQGWASLPRLGLHHTNMVKLQGLLGTRAQFNSAQLSVSSACLFSNKNYFSMVIY